MTKGRRGPGKKGGPTRLESPANSRELAFSVLSEYKTSGRLIAPLLESHAQRAGLAADERALASEIAHGVVRRRATLNTLLQHQIDRPRHRVEGALWTLLQIGAYQLVLLGSVPSHAAVNETVNVAGRLGQPNWRGFLNGVLRSVARELTDQLTNLPAADAVPLNEGCYRRLSRPCFGDPDDNLQEYVVCAFSFPEWLIERWQRQCTADELLRTCFWYNTRGAVSLRVNMLRSSREQLLEALGGAGVIASAGVLPEAVRLAGTVRVDTLPGYREGWFAVQDSSAMHAADLLAPQPGERILDMCAAPGTKTTHLAERMRDDGTIVATDIRPDRLELVEQNCRRLGIGIVETRQVGRDGADLPEGPFDAVLVDVPCSNTGVLGKRPEARWRIKPEDLRELPQLQLRLLRDACDRTRPGGRVLYSTCSIEPEENQQVVHQLLTSRPKVQMEQELTHLPGRPADGGYQALLRFIK